MTEAEKDEIHNHVQAIAAILYKDTERREPEKLRSLEGIEIAVREQMQNCVSKDIGIFLSQQAREQNLAGQEN
jgi:hypothetical protein